MFKYNAKFLLLLTLILLTQTKKSTTADHITAPATPEELIGLDLTTTAQPNNANPVLSSDLDLDENTPFVADISLNFENASLLNFLKKVEAIFKVSFIFDEDIKLANLKDSKESKPKIPDNNINNPDEQTIATAANNNNKNSLENSKISFATNQPLTKQELWHLTDQFLKVAGYARVRVTGVSAPVYRITALGTAMQEVVPVFINVDANKITESGIIRYIYFLKNSTPAQMLEVLDKIKSKSAKINSFANLQALIFTDTADNIKSLMEVVRELDRANTPEMLSIIKLKKADATEIAELIKKLAGHKNTPTGYATYPSPFLKNDKLSSSLKEAHVIVEARSNTLLVLGPRTAITTVEQIVQEFDTDTDRRRTNFWVVPLNHTPAKQMAELLNQITQFGVSPASNSPANQVLGLGQARLHGQDRLFGNLHFEPEGQGNNLVIRGEPEDYKLVLEVIKQLDRKQPQVAIEAIIVILKTEDTKGLWAQINSAQNRNVNAATSGWRNDPGQGGQVVTNPLTGSLIGNLLTLAQNPLTSAGTTLVSIGKNSAWALIGVLSKFVTTNVVASPFVIATNKYPARVSVGQTRRVQAGTVVGAGGSESELQSMSANLNLDIIPQINSNGIINLEITVKIEDFSVPIDDTSNANAGDTTIKLIQTCTNVADGEVLALGGLVKRTTSTTETNVPILSKIPIIGNLFRNRTSIYDRDTLLVFITPRIINHDTGQNCSYTMHKSNDLQQALGEAGRRAKSRDPIVKWFFKDYRNEDTKEIQRLVDQRHQTTNAVCAEKTGAPAAQLAQTAATVPPKRRSALLDSVETPDIDPDLTDTVDTSEGLVR